MTARQTKCAAMVVGVFVTVLLAVGRLHAQPADPNWAQWRGPLATGAAPVANPPLTWGDNSNIRWKVKIPGAGKSTPIIWDNFIFIQTAIPTGKKVEPAAQPANVPPASNPGRGGMSVAKPTEMYQFVLMCLDRRTGKTVWQQVAAEQVPHEGHHRSDGTFASASPVTDGRHIIAFFGSRGVYCYDMSGKLQWSHDLGDMRIVMSFGEGSSPALHGNILVVNWDHEGECFTVAFDKTTGKILWKVPREERSSWATPLIVEHEGKLQAITAATNKVRSYELESGKLIWECAGLTRNVIPCPVAADGVVYLTSGYQGNALLAIRLGRGGDLTGTDAIVWKYGKNTPYVPSPLLYDGRLYLFAGNNANLTCFEAKSGRVLIDAQRLDGPEGVYASPVAADGRIYIVGRNGTTVVLKNSDKLEVLATNKLEDRIDASPALVGKELYLRGVEYLYCIAE